MHDIDTSCPADLKPYADAYNLDKKQRDNDMWMWFGTYGLSAVSVAVEHCLAGKKAKSKYIDKPITEHSLLFQSTLPSQGATANIHIKFLCDLLFSTLSSKNSFTLSRFPQTIT